MNQKSARSLMWLSIILLVAGSAIGSPNGVVMVMILAALCALAPVISEPKWPRIVGIIVLIASLSIAVAHYSAAQRRTDTFQERVKKNMKNYVPPIPANNR